MMKRNFLSALNTLPRFIHSTVLLALLTVQPSYSKEPIPANVHIDNYFVSLDSLLSAITISNQVRTKKAVVVTSYFTKIEKNTPELISLLRTNSKGIILNEVTNGKVRKRKNRNIRRQAWFKTIAKTRKPYYGNLKKGKDNYTLFWARPKTYKKNGKKTVFTGAIAAKFDLKKCLDDISEEHDVAFAVYSEGKKIYSNLDKTASGELIKKDADVYGFEKVTVRFFKPVRQPDQDSLAREKEKAAAIERQKRVEAAAIERKKKEEELKKNRAIMKKNTHTFLAGVSALVGIPVSLFMFGVIITKIRRGITKYKIDKGKF